MHGFSNQLSRLSGEPVAGGRGCLALPASLAALGQAIEHGMAVGR